MTSLTLNDLNLSKELDAEAMTDVFGRGNHLCKIGAYNKWVFKCFKGYVCKHGRRHRKERWDFHRVTQYNYYRQC